MPCIQEHPDLIEFVDQQRALDVDGAEFYSVCGERTRGPMSREFFDERGGDWPIVYPVDRGAIDVSFGVAQVPETWIVDPAGVVRARLISRVTDENLNVTLQQLREATG